MPDELHDDLASGSDPSSGSTHGSNAIVTLTPRQLQTVTPNWYSAPAIPEIITSKPTPIELLNALRRRWMVATGLGLSVGALLAALVWFFVPVRFEVAALLRVAAVDSGVVAKPIGLRDAEYATYKKTQAALLKSSFVLRATLRKPEISRLKVILDHADDPIGWLSDELIVDYPTEAEIMRVAMRGDRPKELKDIVNAVTNSYLTEIVDAEKKTRLEQRNMLEKNHAAYRTEIRTKMTQLHDLHEKLGTNFSEAAQLKRKRAMHELDMLTEQSNQLQRDIGNLDLKITMIEARSQFAGELKPPDMVIDQHVNADPQIQQMKQQLAQTRRALVEEQRRASKGDAPSVQRIQEEVQNLEDSIEEQKQELRHYIIEAFGVNPDSRNPTEFLPLLKEERRIQVENLDKKTAAAQEKLLAITKMESYSSEIETREAELRELQEATKVTGAELKLWQFELDNDARPRIAIMDPATAPTGSDAARKYVGVGFAGILGLAGVLFGVALIEFQSRRLNSVRDVREGLGIRVVGHLPGLSGRAWRQLDDPTSPTGAHLQSLLTESIDSIRATLLHSNGANPPRVVMVASSESQEGKTTVASQLAASLWRAGRRTLLLDGDLRNPSTHAVFNLPLEPGFCEVLRGDAEREAALYATPAKNLWLMPAGQYDSLAVEAISSNVLAKLLGALKEQFEFVIVDSPPVLKVADPLIFGQCIDAALISVRRDVSRIPKIYEACERLKSVGVKVLGAVVNGVDERSVRRPAPIARV